MGVMLFSVSVCNVVVSSSGSLTIVGREVDICLEDEVFGLMGFTFLIV